MPDKTAIITVEGTCVDYSALVDRIKAAASFLRGRDIRRGDRIMLSAQKEVEFVYFYFASHLIGAQNVVVDQKSAKERIEHIASQTAPRLAIGVETDGVAGIDYGDVALPENCDFILDYECNDEDTADIMFTSGTTGKPKGVLLSHANIWGSANNINAFIGNTADDIEFLGLPICHSFGLGRLRCSLINGATVVLHNGFANLKSVFQSFERYNATGFAMVPAIWAYIKRFSGNRIGKYAPQIRYIEIGSAAMPIEDKKELAELFPDTRICMHYGLTEASRSAFMEFHQDSGSLDSIGVPVTPEVDIRVMDADGNELVDGNDGEICVKGNMVIKSYLNEEDNQGSFFGQYFRTGDWGYRGADGNLRLISRKKELINVGGKKVSPIEIEDALTEIGVGESMCVAMKDPDGILGEVPKALLVSGTFNLSIDEIRCRLKERLDVYKIPKVFEVVEYIPKTESGKKQRTL